MHHEISTILTRQILAFRFLVFRNLAEAFFKQGPEFHEDALQCFLHAVSIDAKDVTVWNRLGTLACLLGSYNVARWAFEQGLHCSPQHCKHCWQRKTSILH
jgi:calcineurin-binding protein cabin-1